MPTKETRAKKGHSGQLRALSDMSLRKRPDRRCNDWHNWKKGTVFTPPPHMDVERAIARGIAEPAKGVASD